MKTSRRSSVTPVASLKRPREFVSRLLLAELLAKRGEGPLERKSLKYRKRRVR